jgi:hypothetical protein
VTKDYLDPEAVRAVEVHGWDPYAEILLMDEATADAELDALDDLNYSIVSPF